MTNTTHAAYVRELALTGYLELAHCLARYYRIVVEIS